MKYIIDIPKEHEFDWVNKSSRFGFELCFPINETATNKKYHIPTGLKLESYTEPDREAIEDEVWGFVKQLECMTFREIEDCFDAEYDGVPFVANVFSYQEAKAKYDAWKKRKDEIHVGDEIVGIYSDGEKTPPLVVLKVEGNYYYGIYSKTGEYVQGGLNYEKTGRHFDEVEELLKKMRGEE